jgi:ribosomal protein L44E
MQPIHNKRTAKHGRDYGHKGPPSKEPHSKPTGTWRKKYDCKITKGAHTYELVKPSERFSLNEHTADEYYDKMEAEYRECIAERDRGGEDALRRGCWIGFYHFRCTSCGKRYLSQTRKLKKI